ncbi:MAG TPA: hypothetical protein VFQ22_11105 [Longimicrobiales bacterium]|nr:hypothetical protein [Longimicrobiales bacterium]
MKRRMDEKAMRAAGDAAANALATISVSLDRMGERARRAALAVRDRLHDGSVAVSRGERHLRTSGLGGGLRALATSAARHKIALAGAAGATMGIAAIAAVRRRGGKRVSPAPWESRPEREPEPEGWSPRPQ